MPSCTHHPVPSSLHFCNPLFVSQFGVSAYHSLISLSPPFSTKYTLFYRKSHTTEFIINSYLEQEQWSWKLTLGQNQLFYDLIHVFIQLYLLTICSNHTQLEKNTGPICFKISFLRSSFSTVSDVQPSYSKGFCCFDLRFVWPRGLQGPWTDNSPLVEAHRQQPAESQANISSGMTSPTALAINNLPCLPAPASQIHYMPNASHRWDPHGANQNPILGLNWPIQASSSRKSQHTPPRVPSKTCTPGPFSLSALCLNLPWGPSRQAVYFLQDLWVISVPISVSLVVCCWTLVHQHTPCPSLNKCQFNKIITCS